ncbi:MAG: LptA/OstA family protein [Pseudobdellovibrionaceae bacterium]|jgi:lipopolysaccharide export system protein LptA|nr:LptA/OstA family protein [Pseudobdellovibrionaceae bacterium]
MFQIRTYSLLLTTALFLGGLSVPVPAVAQDVPLEITADQALEWNQTAKTYTARGNAKAQQGDFSVSGDTLTAFYEGKNNSTSDLNKVTSEGHVVILSGQADNADRAEGTKAIYDITGSVITLTGDPSNRPKVTHGKDVLVADEIKVFMNGQEMERAEAVGSVQISTSGEQKASGDKAIYTKATNIAELVGTVKIMQGFNWIEGDYAKMNLTTKVSTITGQKNRPRVKGIFYPSSGKKK